MAQVHVKNMASVSSFEYSSGKKHIHCVLVELFMADPVFLPLI